jgi:hypothetical protein
MGELRTMFLDMIQEFYEENENFEACTIMETIFANNLESFYLTRKDGSFQT